MNWDLGMGREDFETGNWQLTTDNCGKRPAIDVNPALDPMRGIYQGK
jgi:hypothetical protein